MEKHLHFRPYFGPRILAFVFGLIRLVTLQSGLLTIEIVIGFGFKTLDSISIESFSFIK